MRSLLVLLLAFPLVAQLPPGTSRVTYHYGMQDATFFAATPDDRLWAASFFGNDLERIELAGNAKSFELAPSWPGTRGLTAGPDGALWLGGSSFVARMDPATGAVKRFALGAGVVAEHILSGPDGNLWFQQGRWVTRLRLDGVFLSVYDIGPAVHTGRAFGSDGALYVAAPGQLVRITAAGETTTFASSPRYYLYSGPGFLWSATANRDEPKSPPAGEILKLGYRGETLATYRIAMTPVASDALGNLWLRSTSDAGEILGQLSPAGVLTRFGPFPALPSTDCFQRTYGGLAFLADGRVAMSDYYPDIPQPTIAPCFQAQKPQAIQNTVTIVDPRIAPVQSIEVLNPVRRRGARH